MEEKDMPLATPQTASHPAPTSEALGLPWEASEDGVVIRAIDSNVMGNIVCLQPGFERSFMRWPDRRAFIVQACNSHAALVKALSEIATVNRSRDQLQELARAALALATKET